MSLGKRVSLIVLLTLAMLLVTMSLVVDRFIVQEFRAHDTATLQRHIERVQGAFKNMEQQLAAKMIDWAQWDDSYEFIQSGNPQYIHENLNFLTLSALGLQHMVYFDSAGNPAYPYEVFPREERVASVPSATLETLRTAPLAQRASDTPTTGLLQLGQSLVLFASSPILDSKREKEARGTLLGTVAINPAMLKT